jgi:hypothetical protein
VQQVRSKGLRDRGVRRQPQCSFAPLRGEGEEALVDLERIGSGW